jgi:adenylosuccinate lyase
VANLTAKKKLSNIPDDELPDFDLFSPTDFRYAIPELMPYLSEEAFVKYKAKVEGALALQLAKQGLCSMSAAKEIEDACGEVRASEVYAEEDRIKHDIRALANVIASKVSNNSKPFVHLAATSYDIVDTANALRFKDALQMIVMKDLLKLERALIALSREYAEVVQVGRTHGQHAEPITFGFYLSFYVSRLGKRILAIQDGAENLTGKFAGAVGVYGPLSLIVNDPQGFEKSLLDSLGLQASEVSSQIVQPEPMTDLFHYVISTLGVIANFSRDMRNLQRSEIAEVSEQFSSKQVGSSTMPQKRNPISFENIESIWKKFMPQMTTIYMDQITEHQRDLTNSSSQRYLPELIVMFDYAVRRLTRTIWNADENRPRLGVDLKNMKRNLEESVDSMAAEPFYILLAVSGQIDAHEKVREAVQRSIGEGTSFRESLKRDPTLKDLFDRIPKDKRKCIMDPSLYTGIAAKKARNVADRWEKKLALK